MRKRLLEYAFRNRIVNVMLVFLTCMAINMAAPHMYQTFNTDEYLAIHTLLEFVAVLVAFSIGILVWLIKEGLEGFPAKFILVTGLTFFAVSLVDLIHILSFNGMPVFITSNSEQKAILLFVSGRFIVAFGIIAAITLPSKWFGNVKKAAKVINGFLTGIVAAVLFLAMEQGLNLPLLFVEGEGLTELKIYLEYSIIGLYGLCGFLLWAVRLRIGESIFYKLIYFLIFSGFSDLTFTFYENASDTFNLLGHLYKVTAYYFLFKAISLSSIVNYFYTLGEMGKMSAELLKDQISVEAVLQIQMPKLRNLLPQAQQSVVGFACGPSCFHTAYSEGRFSELFTVGNQLSIDESFFQLGDAIRIIDDPESLLTGCPQSYDTAISVIFKASSQMLYIPLTAKGTAYGFILAFTFGTGCFSLEDVEKVRVFQHFGTLAIAQANNQETRLSYEDSLTGLPNRRFFFEELDKIKYEADTYGIPFTAVYIDMNDLKYLNDNIGHEAGDDALRLIGKTIKSVLRQSDVPARHGGDEFAIIFRHMGRSEGEEKIEELKQTFAKLELPDIQHSFSAAVGGASYPEEACSVDTLLGLADDRMYEHKRQLKAAKA